MSVPVPRCLSLALAFAILLLFAGFPWVAWADTPPPPAAQIKLAEHYGKLPLSFEENQGQTAGEVKFLSRGPGYSLFLTSTEAVLALRKPKSPSSSGRGQSLSPARHGIREPMAGVGADLSAQQPPPVRMNSHRQGSKAELETKEIPAANKLGSKEPDEAQGAVLRMRLAGAREPVRIVGQDHQPGTVNYLKGRDPAQWRTGLATYGKVEYQGVYPGVDLVYYGNQRQLEYDFIVAPGADPKQIRLSFTGNGRDSGQAVVPRLDGNGDLLLPTEAGEVRLHKPVVYQDIDGRRREIDGRFVLLGLVPTRPRGNADGGAPAPHGRGTAETGSHAGAWKPGKSSPFGKGQGEGDLQVGFQVAEYDHDRPLVIDPVLVYSTYLGGSSPSNLSGGDGIAVDSAGNAYVTGYTESADFPAVNAKYPHLWGDQDAFVTKLSANGQTVVYSTYLGGSGLDQGSGIAVDSVGNAYVTGDTDSVDFPAVNAKYPQLRGWSDAFVTKLSANGQTVVYSTYLGGNDGEWGDGIALDSAGNATVTGMTQSADFPIINAKYPHPRGGRDAFVTKLSANGQTVVYSTYLGGSGIDWVGGIAVDSAGDASVTGYTESADFPTVNAKYPQLRGRGDAFVTKLSANGQTVVYSTYLGGSGDDGGGGIAVDSAGNATVTGSTSSADFPAINAKYPHLWGSYDAFVTKLSANGQTVVYSTYLGGSGQDEGQRIAVDSAGNATVIGDTYSVDFPAVNAKYPQLRGWGDAFVTKLSANGQTVVYSTYLGGSGWDEGHGIAVDSAGNAYVTGWTESADFPTSATDPKIISYDPTYNGGDDAFVAKFTPGGSTDPNDQADVSVSLTRTGGSGPVYVGDTVQLDLRTVNAGPAVAQNVVLSLTYPAGLSVTTSEPACTATAQTILCKAGNRNAGSLASFGLTLKVQSAQVSTLTLNATAQTDTYDPQTANNSVTLGLQINPRVAVVLVHGWTDSWAAFSQDQKFFKANGTVCANPSYPQSYRVDGCLPRFGHLLRQDAKLLVAQPFDYNDKTGGGGTSGRPVYNIQRLAGELHKHIECVLRGECMFDKQPVNRVDIVAHSMGGLVTRAYIAGLARDAANKDAKLPYNGKIRRLLTVGTPHYGADWTVVLGFATPNLLNADTDAQQTQMKFGSSFLWALDAYWQAYVAAPGLFDSANLLNLAGNANMRDISCGEDNNDGIVYLSSAVLRSGFLPSSQIRYVPYPHSKLLCTAVPPLVGINNTLHLSYQFAKAFLTGTTVPNGVTPAAKFLNNALVTVRLVDKQTQQPINPGNASFWFTNAAGQKIALPHDPIANTEGGTLTAQRVPLAGSQQAVKLWIAPPAGYATPAAIPLTLQAGRPTLQQVALQH